jgi:hypothetical protein
LVDDAAERVRSLIRVPGQGHGRRSDARRRQLRTDDIAAWFRDEPLRNRDGVEIEGRVRHLAAA